MRRHRRRGGYIRHVYRGGVLQRNVDTHADCKIAGRAKKRRATKADNFVSAIMSCFHADTLSRDRGVTPRLFIRKKKTGFDSFITYPRIGFTVIVSHEWQYLRRKDSQTALYRSCHVIYFNAEGLFTHRHGLSM